MYVQPGRGGGWQLVGDARTNLSGLSGPESRAVFWLLGTAGLSGPETRVATMKLIRALPRTLRDEAERLATSIHYDHRAWGEPLVERVEGAERLDLLREAIVHRRAVTMTYASRTGAPRSPTLHPLGLVAKAGDWYLVADGDPGPRTYRVSRIAQLQLTEATFEPPPGFDLVAYWRDHVEQVEGLRSGVAATLRVLDWVVPILQGQFGRQCTVMNTNDGHTVVEVRAHLLVGLAEQLAGWGSRVEVISPPALREELRRIGRELVALPA